MQRHSNFFLYFGLASLVGLLTLSTIFLGRWFADAFEKTSYIFIAEFILFIIFSNIMAKVALIYVRETNV